MLMPTAELEAMLAAMGLADELAALAPVAHVELALVPTDDAGATRLGGPPEVPADFAWPCQRWPRAEVEGWPDHVRAELATARAAGQVHDDGAELVMPLACLGQLDLAAVRACDPTAALPATGRLLLFASVTTDLPDPRFSKRVAAAVRHVDDVGVTLAPAVVPPTCDPPPAPARGLRVERRLALDLTWEDQQALRARLTTDGQRAWLDAALARSHALLAAPLDELVGPMPPPGWTALARLVDDPEAGFMVGDASWLTFAIADDDLAAGRWDRACASVFIG